MMIEEIILKKMIDMIVDKIEGLIIFMKEEDQIRYLEDLGEKMWSW